MSTTPYATVGQTRQIPLTTSPVLLGSNGDGSPLAKRVMWHGTPDDATVVQVVIAYRNDGDPYPLQAGVETTRVVGPTVSIYGWTTSGTASITVSEEGSP